jgi:hypothetical protein
MPKEEQITKAVKNLIDSWDMDTLINFAYEERFYYFMDKASDEEVDELLDIFLEKVMRRSRFIRIKHPECINVDDMYKNNEGLWKTLKINKISKKNQSCMLWTKRNVYKLEV